MVAVRTARSLASTDDDNGDDDSDIDDRDDGDGDNHADADEDIMNNNSGPLPSKRPVAFVSIYSRYGATRHVQVSRGFGNGPRHHSVVNFQPER